MPAAAVIPAPIAYIKVAAVKKLVVGFLVDTVCRPRFRVLVFSVLTILPIAAHFSSLIGEWYWIFYFEKIRVFQAGFML